MTTIQLNVKRRRKELKRKAKRKAVFLAKVHNLKGLKERILKERALRVIKANPKLLEKFLKTQNQGENNSQVQLPNRAG